jgi:hypothetical protein
MMKTRLGPILGFASASASTWNCRALYVFQNLEGSPPDLAFETEAGAQSASGRRLYAYGGHEVWVYDLPFERAQGDRQWHYGLPGETPAEVTVPGRGATPHFAYASCCGFHDWNEKTRLESQDRDPWAMVEDLRQIHQAQPFHILLLGGDQIYMDSLWSKGPMFQWRQKLRRYQKLTAWTDDGPLDRQARTGFLDLYCDNWGREPFASVLARIPTFMMWDDHDICDGWGSHPDDVQAFPVMQGLFRVARDYFEVFQLQQAPGAALANAIGAPGQFSSLHMLGDTALLALDLRSRRSRQRVFTDAAGYRALFAELDRRWPADSPPGHLLVLSSVPVVYPSGPSDLTGLWLWDPIDDPQDDLIDQWSDHRHQAEREIFVRSLLDFARSRRVRVTLVCGDVHLGALGSIESDRDEDRGGNHRVLTQLISSALVNVPPGGLVLWAIQQATASPQTVFRHVTGEIMPLGTGLPRLLAARNWLSIRPQDDGSGSLAAAWHVEGLPSCPPKTITPVRS